MIIITEKSLETREAIKKYARLIIGRDLTVLEDEHCNNVGESLYESLDIMKDWDKDSTMKRLKEETIEDTMDYVDKEIIARAMH